MLRTGFIGLGSMGWHMASHLARKHLLGAEWNRSTDKAKNFTAEFGVRAAENPADVWSDCDTTILCVTADAQVLEMVDALAIPAARGKLVIDTSTVARETAIEAAARLKKVGARFLDAPITGGTEGARNAKLTFMVGGEQKDFTEAAPLFAAMGARHLHMGPHGAGQATKAVNQVMCAGINHAVTEGLAFAEALGLPLEKVIEVTGSGAAGSWFINHRGKTMVEGRYPPGFKLALHHKDLLIVQRMARALGGKLPVTEATLAPYEELMKQGFGEEDISALYRINKKLFPKK
ncbi:MAG: NAD(P)-dependent oxidoreductase [Pseudomonadota bacterium]